MLLTEAGTDDAGDFAAVRRSSAPYFVTSVEGMRLRLGEAGAAAVIREGRRPLGTATVRPVGPQRTRLTLMIARHSRRQGVGTSLLAWAVDRCPGDLLTVVDGDPDSLGFAARHGFVTDHRHQVSGCHPRTVPPGLSPGASTVSCAEVGVAAVHSVYAATAGDDPSGLSDELDLERFTRIWWGDPDLSHVLSQAVVIDGEVAAFSAVEVDPQRRVAWSAMTGTRPSYRGRGLATTAKRATLAALAEAGYERAHTANAAANTGMLAVNRALGYEPIATMWSARRSVD